MLLLLPGSLHATLGSSLGTSYVRTLLIHKYSRALQFNGELYGSLKSIHSNFAMVHVKSDSGCIIPAFVRKFVKVKVILKLCNETEENVDIYLSAVNWLEEHPEKLSPAEVWRQFLHCDNAESFVSVSDFRCRCAYVVDVVNFSPVLRETVTVVVPLGVLFCIACKWCLLSLQL